MFTVRIYLLKIQALYLLFFITVLMNSFALSSVVRSTENFYKDWKFHLDFISDGQSVSLDDTQWRALNLPHFWSIEGELSNEHPATPGGGALPGGIGWYRKTFNIPELNKDKLIFIDFDGIYHNSEVWINGKYLGKRPNGYISFRYELTPHLKYGNEKNILAVKVDNSQLFYMFFLIGT